MVVFAQILQFFVRNWLISKRNVVYKNMATIPADYYMHVEMSRATNGPANGPLTVDFLPPLTVSSEQKYRRAVNGPLMPNNFLFS